MAAAFDPYHKWLGIPPAEQPPHHYRLLGLALFEHDADVIEIAADQRMALLRSFHTGPHSDLSQRLLNEVAAARLCLLKPDRRERYDEVLRARLGSQQPPTVFDKVHERKNPPAAASSAAAAPPPVVSAPAKPPPVPPAVKPPSVPSRQPAAPPAVKGATPAPPKPAAASKSATDVQATAIALKSPTDLAKSASAATGTGTLELVGKSAKKSREIELAPKSSDWDQAIAEACSTQSVVYRRRRRWHVSQSIIQLAIAGSLLGGLVYGAAVGFRMWQDYESKHTNERSVAKKANPPPPPATSTTITAAPEPPSNDSPANQPEAAPTETPNFGSRRPTETRPSAEQGKPRNPAETNSAHSSPTVPNLSGSGYDTGGRHPIPDSDAQKKAAAEIDEILKRDYQQAVGVINKVDLAHTLARLANDTRDDPVKHYVLDEKALAMAVNFCDVPLAAQVVRDLIANFQVDPWDVRIGTLKKLASAPGTIDRRTVIAEAAYSLIDEALAEERYETALELANLSFRLAAASRAFAVRDQAHEAVERIKQTQKRQAAFEAANSALAGNPDDPDANLTVGKFKCFVKQDWQDGLPYLAKAGDEPLRRLAEREAKPPAMPADQLSLADSWWELAAEREDPKNEVESKAMRSRAAYWYRQASPGLSGINLEKARRRVEGL